ncbi:MAG TPA: hypothetical protein VLC12_06615 [Terriglobales bacterium]|nr:hypothetical protein [Terriglobales bacterium]
MPVSAPNPPRSVPIGAVIVAAPFALAGLFAAFMAAHNLNNGTAPWPVAAVVGSAAFVFVGAAFALVLAGTRGRRRQRILADLQGTFPDSPWMWREDWAQSRCESRLKNSITATWTIALLWNGISVPLVFAMSNALSAGGLRKNPGILVAFIFPLIGIGLLVWAVRATLRRIEFGRTCFLLSPTPGVIGGRLRGNIQARFPHGVARGLQLKLSCVNRVVTGSGKNQSTWEKIRWREQQTIPPERLMPGPEGALIPVDFQIPSDALACDNANPRDAILWILEADADVPGVNYLDTFEVPVFRTKDSPALAAPVDRSNAFADVPEGPAERPAGSRIIVQPSPAGGVMFKFPALRNLGAVFGTTAFFLIWTTVVWFLWTHAPFFFTFFFGLFDAIILLIVLSLWMGSSVVTFEAGTVSVRGGLLSLGPRHVVACSDLAEIQIPIGMQMGSAQGTPYYNIQLVCRDGRKITAGQNLRDKQEAEWLVAEMKKAAGLPLHAAVASAR